ncbi:MAG: HpcH/HpaI aldolase/citrate lyase family protein [Bacillota bacterium]
MEENAVRPLRSILFAPGNDLRKAQKAISAGADAVILDLEDAVAPEEKPRAREVIREAMTLPRQSKLYVRVNAVGTAFLDGDLQAVVREGIDGLMLPKAESAEDIRTVDMALAQLEKKQGLSIGQVELIPLVETAQGVWWALETARSCSRVRCMAFGALDFTLDIGTSYSKEGTEIAYARSRMVLASRVAGIEPPIDTVFPDTRDQGGLEKDCRLARQLGFQGKLLIHPLQVETTNRIFSPETEEIAFSLKVVKAFNQAMESGTAVLQVDGKMVDRPVVIRAQRVLAIAQSLGLIQAE